VSKVDVKEDARRVEIWIDQLADARRERCRLRAEIKEHRGNMPVCPAEFESVQAAVQLRQDALAWGARDTELNADLSHLEIRIRELEKHIIARVPPERWIRCGNTAVGVYVDNRGGFNRGVDIRPWAPELPSLDRRHRGD